MLCICDQKIKKNKCRLELGQCGSDFLSARNAPVFIDMSIEE